MPQRTVVVRGDAAVVGVWAEAEVSSDLALLIEVARRADGSLVGPPPREIVPAVPPDDLRRAAVDGVPESWVSP